MCEGFIVHLSLDDFNSANVKRYRAAGLALYEGIGFPSNNDESINGELLKYVSGDEHVIDGTKTQKKWFPQFGDYFDVFISHSHDDIELALVFAGYLKIEFGLRAFIDYYVWGYAERLQDIVDDKVCEKTKNGCYTISSRNKSTAHVHMMLATALMQAMENTRCLFFLNTEKSTSLMAGELKTYSPWIHGELFMYHMLRRQVERKLFSIVESVSIVQDADTIGMKELCRKSFNKLKEQKMIHAYCSIEMDPIHILVNTKAIASEDDLMRNNKYNAQL